MDDNTNLDLSNDMFFLNEVTADVILFISKTKNENSMTKKPAKPLTGVKSVEISGGFLKEQ
jgi:hypothetical protein